MLCISISCGIVPEAYLRSNRDNPRFRAVSAIRGATVGNTLGGVRNWWMGLGAHQGVDRARHSRTHLRALDWLQRLGPKACFFAFLPVIGDPLTAVAGWLRLPLAPCTAWMALGKFLRYVLMTTALLYVWPEGF